MTRALRMPTVRPPLFSSALLVIALGMGGARCAPVSGAVDGGSPLEEPAASTDRDAGPGGTPDAGPSPGTAPDPPAPGSNDAGDPSSTMDPGGDAGADPGDGEDPAGGSGGDGGADGAGPGDEPPPDDPSEPPPDPAPVDGCVTPLSDGRRIDGSGAPLVRTDPGCGALTYARYANQGESNVVHAVPDFSFAGYAGGGVALPAVPVVVTLQPAAGDNRARIQAALDEVAARAPDARGLRGAVLLAAGRYEVGDTLFIDASGVVLRGAGQGAEDTVLVATRRAQHDLIVVRGSASGLVELAGTRTAITSELVPVGARSFDVASAAVFAPGDTIAVVRTPNQAWIDDIGMDTWGWTPAGFHVEHERTIEAIDGLTITVDVPMVDTIEDGTGGGQVFLADTSQRIRQAGVEDLRLESVYASQTDEDHGWKAVVLQDAESCWVRGVTARYFGYAAVSVEGASRFNTVEEVAQLDPISIIDGGRRYSFNVMGGSSGTLFQRCYAREGRHNFVTGARVPGPNVWLDCLSEDNHADEGPHHRWATGMLLDNIESSVVNVQNREDSGTGHGWAGAQTMFWNIVATDEVRADAPRGAMNWAIGVQGDRREGSWAPEEPFGWWESRGVVVAPRSLYLAQLRDRLGDEAVEAVTVHAQRSGRIWEQLSAWAGNGSFAAYVPDPSTGCEGILEGNVCCPLSCGACGGTGCGSRPGGAAACCSGAIRESGITCDEAGPPCVVP